MLHKTFRFISLSKLGFWALIILMSILASCHSKRKNYADEEWLKSGNNSKGKDSLANSILTKESFNQIETKPNAVLLTGQANHRLVTVYKVAKKDGSDNYRSDSYSYYSSDYNSDPTGEEHFMPGIDIHYGFNLIFLGHYDFKTEKINSFFDHPVLVKTIYFPSFILDSLNNKPINRDYYLISAYDEDTNNDSLINKKDLRKIYRFNLEATVKTALLPVDYSAVSSQYDSQNDVMYIFAKYDANKNGMIEEKEPTHIFWISLKAPEMAKRLY